MSIFSGIPREKIPWYPTIDYEKCAGCQECYNFCHNGVFEWDEENNQPKVVQPYNCVIGCSACANLCATGAIKFPTRKELVEAINKIREGGTNEGKRD
jgi:NAD-dependent dihydropyrimidine dehydrogenase PreA subunit|uniref:Ferredoxin family protein n=1 Tax=candidate division WOR-3 bacterium TaxID=2052148 RepID=A0A7C6A943_UNCW3